MPAGSPTTLSWTMYTLSMSPSSLNATIPARHARKARPAQKTKPDRNDQVGTLVSSEETLVSSEEWSERRDLNPRPPDPQSDALPGCATLRPCLAGWAAVIATGPGRGNEADRRS